MGLFNGQPHSPSTTVASQPFTPPPPPATLDTSSSVKIPSPATIIVTTPEASPSSPNDPSIPLPRPSFCSVVNPQSPGPPFRPSYVPVITTEEDTNESHHMTVLSRSTSPTLSLALLPKDTSQTSHRTPIAHPSPTACATSDLSLIHTQISQRTVPSPPPLSPSLRPNEILIDDSPHAKPQNIQQTWEKRGAYVPETKQFGVWDEYMQKRNDPRGGVAYRQAQKNAN